MINELLTDLADKAAARLSPTPARVVVVPGDPVWDDCCQGQVWSRLVSLQPSGRPFPQFDAAQPGAGCNVVIWAATVAIGVMRCAAVLDENGNAPTPAQIKADAKQQVKDLRALEKVMFCDIPAMAGFQSLKVVGWEPQGPEGGCVGGEWKMVLAVGVCGCEDPESPCE